jgi:hypothetical protein
MIKDWLHNLFGCKPEYPESPNQQKIEQKTEEAEEAVRQADQQLMEARKIQEEGKAVGQAARRIRYENHFTSRIRRSLEGR